MESKKVVVVALMAMMLVATSSAKFYVEVDDTFDFISDGRAQTGEGIGLARNIMKGRVFEGGRICPRILMECKEDSDCLAQCICQKSGYCG